MVISYGDDKPDDEVVKRMGWEMKAHADRFVASMASESCCSYCGDPATSWDHVVPHSFEHAADTTRKYSRGVVPCCHHCNSTLGAVFCGSLDARLEHLAQRIRKKYAKLLKAPDWTDQEIKELGSNLRDSVIAIRNEKRHAIARLAFLERGSFDAFNELFNSSPYRPA